MEDKRLSASKNYKSLRQSLVAWLKDLERGKKHGKNAISSSRAIGGSLQKETTRIMAKYEELSQRILKLEQETREI